MHMYKSYLISFAGVFVSTHCVNRCIDCIVYIKVNLNYYSNDNTIVCKPFHVNVSIKYVITHVSHYLYISISSLDEHSRDIHMATQPSFVIALFFVDTM